MVSFLGNVPRLRVWPRQVDRVPKCPQVQDDTSLSVGPIYLFYLFLVICYVLFFFVNTCEICYALMIYK